MRSYRSSPSPVTKRPMDLLKALAVAGVALVILAAGCSTEPDATSTPTGGSPPALSKAKVVLSVPEVTSRGQERILCGVSPYSGAMAISSKAGDPASPALGSCDGGGPVALVPPDWGPGASAIAEIDPPFYLGDGVRSWSQQNVALMPWTLGVQDSGIDVLRPGADAARRRLVPLHPRSFFGQGGMTVSLAGWSSNGERLFYGVRQGAELLLKAVRVGDQQEEMLLDLESIPELLGRQGQGGIPLIQVSPRDGHLGILTAPAQDHIKLWSYSQSSGRLELQRDVKVEGVVPYRFWWKPDGSGVVIEDLGTSSEQRLVYLPLEEQPPVVVPMQPVRFYGTFSPDGLWGIFAVGSKVVAIQLATGRQSLLLQEEGDIVGLFSAGPSKLRYEVVTGTAHIIKEASF